MVILIVLNIEGKIIGNGGVGGNDDSKLSPGWYKFDVPGQENKIPTYNPGIQCVQNNMKNLFMSLFKLNHTVSH